MKKRLLSLLLTALMIFSLMPMSAFATGTTYAVTNGTPQSAVEKNHGYITIDKETAAEGDTVTVTVKPADGYKLKSLTVVPAPTDATFKAVYNTTGGANTLTFYYDTLDHNGDNITVYEDGTANYLFDNSKGGAARWGYNSIRSKVKSVVIDESVKNYTGLTSTAYMFMTMTNAESIAGAEYLNVSNVTEMSSMFYNYGNKSTSLAVVPNVSNWNTGSVTSMSHMFYNYGGGSASFAVVPDVSKWNTGNITNMSHMFQGYGSTSEVLNVVPAVNGNNWNTAKVTDMSYMFEGYGKSSKQLNAVPDVSKWNTGNVTNMSYMFYSYGFSSKELNVVPTVNGSDWNTGNVTKMNYMFDGYGKNSPVLDKVPDVSKWNTEKVTNMAQMFSDYGSSSTVLTKVPDVSNWKTGSVTDVNNMFNKYGSSSAVLEFKLDLSKWSVASVTDFSNMFAESGAVLPADSDKWNVTIPAKTGERDNETAKWYVGDGNNEKKYIEPAKITSTTYRSFTVAPASKLLKSSPAKSLKSTPAEPEVKFVLQTDGTYQFKMPGYPVVIKAEFEKIPVAELIADALAGTSETSIPGVMDITTNILGVRTVKLLKNIDMGNKDVTVAENVFLDFNHFALTTTGKLTNNGVIILHRENADIVEDLLYKVPGNYAADEELKLPTDVSPDYVIPAKTFMTSEVGTDPAYQELSFASGDDMLVWNKDVPAGVQIDVAYSLTLGGDIIGAKGSNVKPTKVTATNVALNDNIMIGGNDGEGEASLVIESIPGDDPFPETVGTFTANGKKITLGKSGKLVISSNITFDESVLISGAEGMTVAKTENKTDGTVTYFLETPHTHAPVLVNGQAATETVAGFKDYYKCDCGKFFEDATCKVEITNLDAWKAAGGNGYIAKLEEEPKSPQTGDASHMSLWVMLLALSSMGLCACLVLGKKRKNEQ